MVDVTKIIEGMTDEFKGDEWVFLCAVWLPDGGVRVKGGGAPMAYEREMELLSAINTDLLKRADQLKAARS